MVAMSYSVLHFFIVLVATAALQPTVDLVADDAAATATYRLI